MPVEEKRRARPARRVGARVGGTKGRLMPEPAEKPVHEAETLVDALRRDFAAHGRRAIEVARTKQPINYLRLVALLLPRATPADDPSELLSDEELRTAIPRLRQWLAACEDAGGVRSNESETKPAGALPPLSEADRVP